jgi:hypothetical protein
MRGMPYTVGEDNIREVEFISKKKSFRKNEKKFLLVLSINLSTGAH